MVKKNKYQGANDNSNFNEKALYKYVYDNVYPIVKKYIIDNNGTLEDAQDTFQDALLILIEKIKNNSFKVIRNNYTSSMIFKISKNLWSHKLRDNRSYLYTTINFDEIYYAAEPIKYFINKDDEDMSERMLRIKKVLSTMSLPYQKVLNLYFQGINQKRSSQILEYSISYYRKILSIAKRMLKDKIRENPIQYN